MIFKVLLVDDEQPIRKLIRIHLEREGFSVTEASDAAEALARLDDSISLLVSDLAMPGLSGIELAAVAQQRHPDLPVLLMSGYSEEFAGQLSGHYCFKKPFEPRALVRQVRQILEHDILQLQRLA